MVTLRLPARLLHALHAKGITSLAQLGLSPDLEGLGFSPADAASLRRRLGLTWPQHGAMATVPVSLTTAQVASMLQLEPITITVWCRTGKLAAQRVGKAWRIPLAEVQRLLGAGVVGETKGDE